MTNTADAIQFKESSSRETHDLGLVLLGLRGVHRLVVLRHPLSELLNGALHQLFSVLQPDSSETRGSAKKTRDLQRNFSSTFCPIRIIFYFMNPDRNQRLRKSQRK